MELSTPTDDRTEHAVRAFVERHQAPTWRWLRYLGCAPDLAEDLAQEALLAALHHGIDGRPAATAAAWLRTATRRLWSAHRRRAGSHPPQVPLDAVDEGELEGTFLAAEGDDVGAGYLTALEQCLALLHARERRAIELRYRDQAPRTAMAAELGLGEAGIKQLLRRLRAQLRTCIEKRRSG